MKRTLAAALVALAACLYVVGQQQPPLPPQEQAKAELNAGTQAYKAGNFIEAQRHFERALELDPENKQVRLFIARAVHQQYKQGDTSPENLSKADEALSAYNRVLEHDPDNEDAYSAVGYIYRQLGNEQKEREWLMTRATSSTALPYKRATAYTALSVKEWQCSRDVTERKDNKVSTRGRGPTAYVYVKPKDAEEFERARACAARGLQYAEEAVGLAPDFSHAWGAKANILRELSKLAQMENDEARKSSYDEQAATAAAEQKRASAATQRRAAEEEERQRAEKAAATEVAVGETLREGTRGGDPSAPSGPAISGGDLSSKAVSKPQPEYPAAARDARVQGKVTVQVVVSEEGAVISVTPVAGHPLLRAAAVEAARQARFTPTLLSGQPVKVTGFLSYDFVVE